MSYDDDLQQRKNDYNQWVQQQQYRRQDQQWAQARLEADRARAAQDFNAGNTYLGLYRTAGPAAANAYAQRQQELAAWGAQAAAARQPSASDYGEGATKKAEAGDLTGAIADLDKAVRLEPANSLWPYQRGLYKYRLQRYLDAEADFSQSIKVSSSSFAHLDRAKCRVWLGAWDSAFGDLSVAERLHQTVPWATFPEGASTAANQLAEIQLWRGYAHFQKGDFHYAIAAFDAAFAQWPHDAWIRTLRAWCYQRLQFHLRAIEDLTEVLEEHPSADRYRDRAHSYTMIDDYAAAVRDWDQVIRLNPTAAAFAARAFAYLDSGSNDRALADFDVAIRLGERTARVLVGRGYAHRNNGSHAGALEDFTAALQLDPQNALTHTDRGLTYYSLGRFQEAVQDFSAALKLNPTANGYRGRAGAYGRLNDYAAAVRDWDAVIRMDPEPDDFSSRGWRHLLNESYDRALSDFDTAIELGGRNAHLYSGRASARYDSGDLDGAIEDYATVLELDPQDAYAHRRLSRIYYDRGDYAAALEESNQDVSRNPGEPRAYASRGNARLKLGKRKAAEKDFLKAAGLFRLQNMPEEADKVLARMFSA